MARYLLSVHSVDGEATDPMSPEEMQQFMQRVGALEEERKTAGVFLFSGRLHEPSTSTGTSAAAAPSTSPMAMARVRATTGVGATASSWSYARAAELAPTQAERDFLRHGGRAAR